jgi:hypothetical protein
MTDPMSDPTLVKLIELEHQLEGMVAEIHRLERLLTRHFELTQALITGVPPPPESPRPH